MELSPSYEEPHCQDAFLDPCSRFHSEATSRSSNHWYLRSSNLSICRSLVDGYYSCRAFGRPFASSSSSDPEELIGSSFRSKTPTSKLFSSVITLSTSRSACLCPFSPCQLRSSIVRSQNQFFISSTEVEGTVIENKIGAALVSRIVRAHTEGTPWRAMIVCPLVPGCKSLVSLLWFRHALIETFPLDRPLPDRSLRGFLRSFNHGVSIPYHLPR